jgi:hypothetical protein
VGLSVSEAGEQPTPGYEPSRAPSYDELSYRGPNYDGRQFGPTEVLAGSVIGHYHQQSELVWAEFGGDRVRTGRLVGICDNDGVIEAEAHHRLAHAFGRLLRQELGGVDADDD